MKILKPFAVLIAVAVLGVGAAPHHAHAAPPTIEDLIMPSVSVVALSPSGRYLAVAKNAPFMTERMERERGAGQSAILVLDIDEGRAVANIPTETRTLDIKWANDEYFVVNLSKGETVRAFGRAFRDIPLIRTLTIKRDGSEVNEIFKRSRADDFGANAEIIRTLPDDPEHMIMSADLRAGSGVYKVNVFNGEYEQIFVGRSNDGYVLNNELKPVFRVNLNNRGNVVRWYASADGGANWYKVTEFVTFTSGNQPPPFQPVGVTSDPNRMLVIAPQRGDGPTGVYEYDVKTRQYTRTIFEHPLADVTDFREDEGARLRQRVIVQDRKFETTYFDQKYQAIQSGLEDFFGGDVNVSIQEWSNDEQRAVVYVNGPAYPGEYWLFDRRVGSVTLLFRTRDGVSLDQLGEVEILEARMSDGRNIYSYVTHPAGGRNKKAPLIVLPHGGPQARDSFAYSFIAENQVFASRGYRVIQTQFRGGGGYGWSFAREGHGEWGDRIQKDVFESAQVLIDRGLAEKKNIGVWGWSHGGYVAGASAFLNTDVISCAVAGAGVFDLRAMINWERDTDGASSTSYLYWKDAIGDPQTQREKLNAASVAENADKVSVPLMLLHGDEDFTVPVEQSRILRRAMRKAGKGGLLSYKEYDDEPHTPTLANWVDIWERSLDFFGECLEK